ncbi:hypothetical protein KAI58_01890 [Candidatus Gracilibacteria bacterium]|nr:hypothetical protein [Candidatus Gracilibacteria bacterium]
MDSCLRRKEERVQEGGQEGGEKKDCRSELDSGSLSFFIENYLQKSKTWEFEGKTVFERHEK